MFCTAPSICCKKPLCTNTGWINMIGWLFYLFDSRNAGDWLFVKGAGYEPFLPLFIQNYVSPLSLIELNQSIFSSLYHNQIDIMFCIYKCHQPHLFLECILDDYCHSCMGVVQHGWVPKLGSLHRAICFYFQPIWICLLHRHLRNTFWKGAHIRSHRTSVFNYSIWKCLLNQEWVSFFFLFPKVAVMVNI